MDGRRCFIRMGGWKDVALFYKDGMDGRRCFIRMCGWTERRCFIRMGGWADDVVL